MPSVSGNVGAVASVSSVFGRNGGVVAANGDYSGVVAAHLTGATAATRYVGGTASGAPVAGTFAVGDFVIEQTGKVYVCTVAGTPGTWVAPGGDSSVLSTTVPLTDAQIKALPTTSASPPYGYRLVDDPADDTTLIVTTLVTLSLRGPSPYTNIGTNALMVAHAGFHDTELSPELVSGTFWASTDITTILPLTYWTIGSGGETYPVGVAATQPGVGLVLYVTNTLGDFTGGDPANTLTVRTEYRAIPVPA